MFISLIRSETGLASLIDDPAENIVAALSWVAQPDMGGADIGEAHPAGKLAGQDADDLPPNALTFILSKLALSGAGVLACHACEMPGGPALLRMDEVCFPVGAVAHRHTHDGAGIRHLVRGSLRIEAADDSTVMQVGNCWFEGVNCPVRAVSLHTLGVTSFLRAMIIPAAYEGRSTFALANPDDVALPRLQITHRHIDLPLQSEAG